MKKLLSLILTLGLALSLIGCGSKGPEILGVYDTTVELKDMLVEEIDGQMGIDISFGDYIEDFDMVIVSEFNEDGTYKQYLDMEKFEASYEELKIAMVPYMEDMLVEVLGQQLASMGTDIEINSKEDIEALLGMTFDEIMAQSLGMDLETLIDTMMDENVPLDELQEEAVGEGKYKAEDGKLYLSESLDTEIDESVYELYTIEGDVVTITEGVNVEKIEYFDYPMELIKRAE